MEKIDIIDRKYAINFSKDNCIFNTRRETLRFVDLDGCKCIECETNNFTKLYLITIWNKNEVYEEYVCNSLCLIEDNHDDIITIHNELIYCDISEVPKC